MKILILGGTQFLGRHTVEAAVAAGHDVTLFHRGKTNPDLFPDLVHLTGDRATGDYAALGGGTWDAVVDTCGYFPRQVREAAAALAGKVGHYTFISSVSAYADMSDPNLTEESATATLEDPTVEEVTGETYGGLKVLCEQAADEGFPGQTLVLRPGLIVGPHDPTDRFTYWVRRFDDGGEVLAPDDPSTLTQVIDARDLAEWNVRCIEEGTTGVFNAVGPVQPLTMGELMATCRSATGGAADVTWVPWPFLEQHGVQPWAELGAWVPASGDSYGLMRVGNAKAVAAGFASRSIQQTVGDTLEWDRGRDRTQPMRAGLARDKEAKVLAAWHETGQ